MKEITHQFILGRQNKNGECPITYRFNLYGKRFIYGTGKKIFPELWDMERQRPTENKDLINQYKAIEPQIKTELSNISSRLVKIIDVSSAFVEPKLLLKEVVDFDKLKIDFNEKLKIEVKRTKTRPPAPENEQTTPPYISDIIKDYVNGIINGSKLIKTPLSKRGQRYDHETIKAYITFRNTYKEFEDHQEHKYSVIDINSEFENELNGFFNDVKEYTQGMKGKMIKSLKVVINDFIEIQRTKIFNASKMGIKTALSIEDLFHIDSELRRILKPTYQTLNIYLNEDDMRLLYEVDLSGISHLDRARDIFLVGCYTGLRHSDYSRINTHHVKNNVIDIITKKGNANIKVTIPIRPELRQILDKYENKIPKMTPQKLGLYIKQVGKMAGINDEIEIKTTKGNKIDSIVKRKYELITTHTARRSAATNMYYSGIPVKDIMKITGHKKMETFEKYIIKDTARTNTTFSESPFFKGTNYLKVV
jgi:integrase